MRNYVGVIIVVIIAVVIGFNMFGNNGGSRGMTGTYTEDTYGELPSEPSRSEIINNINNSDASSIEELIKQGFPLLDTVRTDRGISKIYMTQELTLPKVAELLETNRAPEEVSQRNDGKQVLVYPDDFVILQESDAEPGLVLIELSSDEFVRNNYSPSFFQGLLAYSLLNRMLDSNDWSRRRASTCQSTGNCYGGYGMYGGFNSGSSGSFRGSSNRGGGPGAGK
ncbi:DUF4247 domain-containing protein [Halobacillus shinanisalinarum]|uniref:DUF4247 domain-containing protein n=1 Tax=Halobacillus shinanisalinarum TaxID=2932258 RepID=A0ABY4H1B3_9BACI|nr:DUF4247 domain-containing protein [Halobacillus shinanisalinarum]UOQ94129.1 DUF4247 domain-containing protein [Halobacillus shinanisalinarum]